MKLKFPLHILILAFFISSCAGKFSLQKKRYSRGFHFSIASRHNNSEKKVAQEKENKAERNSKETTAMLASTNSTNNEVAPEIIAAIENVAIKKSSAKLNSRSSAAIPTFKVENNTKKNNDLLKKVTFNNKRDNGLIDLFTNIYIGYCVLAILFLVGWALYGLFTTYTVAQALTILAPIVLVLLVCYAIGSAFNR